MKKYIIDYQKRKEEKEYVKELLNGIYEEAMTKTLISTFEEMYKKPLFEREISTFGKSNFVTEEQIETIVSTLDKRIQETNVNLFFYQNKKQAIKALFGFNLTHKLPLFLSLFKKEQDVFVSQWEDGVQVAFAEYNLPKNDKRNELAIISVIYATSYLAKEMIYLKNDKKETMIKLYKKSFLFGLRMVRKNKEKLELSELIQILKKNEKA